MCVYDCMCMSKSTQIRTLFSDCALPRDSRRKAYADSTCLADGSLPLRSRRYTCQLFCKTEKLCSQTSKRHVTLTQHTCPFGRHGATSLWLSCLKINDCKKKPKHSVVNWKADWPLHPFDSGAREVGASTRPRSSYHFRYLPCACAACDKRDRFFFAAPSLRSNDTGL